MYCPASFRQDDPNTLHTFIRTYPLGTLITSCHGLEANAIPFLLVESEQGLRLQAHIARANPQLAALKQGGEVLVIFNGPEAYITPTWYPSKALNGKQVPTWNYTMVQVKGTVTVMDDSEWVYRQIDRLTQQQESGLVEPWAVSDAPADYIATQLKAIIGIEIAVTSIKGKFKLSQNRSTEDFQGVVDGLSQSNQPAVASLMKNLK